MEIRIDTTRDSKEDIINAIDFLKKIVNMPETDHPISDNPQKISTIDSNIFAIEKDSSIIQPEIKKKKSPEEELFGDDSIKIIPY